MAERNVLLKNVRHPFLVGLRYSFQTPEKLYFVLDYVNGGEVSGPQEGNCPPVCPLCTPLQSDLTEPLQQSHLVDSVRRSRQPSLHQVPFTPDIAGVSPMQGGSYLLSETPGKVSTKRNVWSLFPVLPFPTPRP